MAPNELNERFLASTTDFAVIHTTVAGVIVAWLGASERVLGFSADEAIGQSLSLFFTEEDKGRGLDTHEVSVALSQGRSEDDRWHVRKDGNAFWASGVLARVQGEDGATIGLCKVLRDKTDVRTQIQSLEHQFDKLKAELEGGRKAVGALAHELRNPLMPIVAAIALLQRKDAVHVADRATKILLNQVEVLKRLVDDLATATEATPEQRVQLERVNLNKVIDELVDGMLESEQARNRTLSLVLPAADIWVAADVARLQQMLINLLNNALKYTRVGGRIDVNASVEDGMAVVRIDDDGVGISAEMLPRIFELFTREARQPDIDGQGVGLAVVKQLATAHRGVIEVRSPGHDKGASFSLRIPLYSI